MGRCRLGPLRLRQNARRGREQNYNEGGEKCIFLLELPHRYRAVNLFIGRTFSWLALGIVVVCFAVVVQRYVFSVSHLWMQDLYIWLNGAMFTAVAGFALLRDDHVRVDIFYRPARVRTRALADLVGVLLFLLPFTLGGLPVLHALRRPCLELS